MKEFSELTFKILASINGHETSEYNTCFGYLNLQQLLYYGFESITQDKKGYFRLLETNKKFYYL